MESTDNSVNIFQNEWAIYLIAFLVLTALFFIQKYAFLLDKKLNEVYKKEAGWEGKPWPLISALFLGLLTYLYNVFSPNDMQQNPVSWSWPEWILLLCFGAMLGVLAFESFTHFGKRLGLIRVLIFVLLSVVFYFAGLLTGLLVVTVLALGILFYFINFWRKRISIK